MATTPFRFLQRRTSVTGRVPNPASLCSGELYIQLADQTIYFLNSTGGLTSVLTDFCGFGLNKIKFSGAGAGDFPVWDGTKFVAYSTGDLVSDLETGVLSTIFAPTGNYVLSSQTGNFITSSQTGNFITCFQTGVFVSTTATGNFVTSSQTGLLNYITCPSSPSSGCIICWDGSSWIAATAIGAGGNNGGDYVTTGQTGNFVTIYQTGQFAPTGDYVKLINDLVPSQYLPSYVDEIFEFNSVQDFCSSTGNSNYIYVVSGCNSFWRWGGSQYVEIYASPGTSDGIAEGINNLYFTNQRSACYVTKNETGSFNTAFAPIGNYVTASQTGNFVTTSQTGNFAKSGNYVTTSQTGQFARTGNYVEIVNGLVPSQYLPSYVDEILEFGSIQDFCNQNGNSNYIYIISGCNSFWRWGGSQYIEIYASPGTSDGVAEGINNLYFTNERSACYVTRSETGLFAPVNNYVLDSQTGNFVATNSTGNFVDKSMTGNFIDMSMTGSFGSSVQTGSLVGQEMTGNFVDTSMTGNFVDTSMTGNFVDTFITNCQGSIPWCSLAPAKNWTDEPVQLGIPYYLMDFCCWGFDQDVSVISIVFTGQTGNFIDTSMTGNFVDTSMTGNFVDTSMTGNFVDTSMTGNFVDTSMTGNFVDTSMTGNFVDTSMTGNFVDTCQTGSLFCQGAVPWCSMAPAKDINNNLIQGGIPYYLSNLCTWAFNPSINVLSLVLTGQTGSLSYVKCPNSPSLGDVISWDGSNWVAAIVSGGGCGTTLPNGTSENSAVCWNGCSWTTGQSYVATGQTGQFVSKSETGLLNYISCPSSPSVGCVLCWDGSSWSLGTASTGNVQVGSCLSGFLSPRNSLILGDTGSNKNIICSTGSARNSLIAMGCCNSIESESINSVLLGGCRNIISGIVCSSAILAGNCNSLIAEKTGPSCEYLFSTIAGGQSNCMYIPCYSFIGGGTGNYLERARFSAILGGQRNVISGSNLNNIFIIGSSITGTRSNTTYVNNLCVFDGVISGNGAGITGLNYVTCPSSPLAGYVICWNGSDWIAAESSVAIASGCCNCQSSSIISSIIGGSGNCQSCSTVSSIVGGRDNIQCSGLYSFIAAGQGNAQYRSCCSSIGGGYCNYQFCTFVSSIEGGYCNCQTGIYYSFIGGGFANWQFSSCYSTIGGGDSNRQCVSSHQSVIGGGYFNIQCGSCCSFIGGGYFHVQIRAHSSFIGGGCYNYQSSSYCSSIVGGACNRQVDSCCSFIGDGINNRQSFTHSSFVGGGGENHQWCSCHSFIGNGSGNCQCILANNSSIVGGTCNFQYSGSSSFIGGGDNNIQCGARISFIGGGSYNCQTGVAHSFIGGGFNNCQFNSQFSSIAGGSYAFQCSSSYSFIGGAGGQTSAWASFIGNGDMLRQTSVDYSVLVGGRDNVQCGMQHSFIGGGRYNCQSGSSYQYSSSIVGGSCNRQTSSFCSFIAGGFLNLQSGACNTFTLGSFVTGTQDDTVYLNKEANYSNTFTLIGTCDAAIIGPLEANIANCSGASLFDIKVVGTYYSGVCYPRNAYMFKQWSQVVVENNVFNGTGCVVVSSGLLYSCFNSDATNFSAGTMGNCATLCGSGNGQSGIYLFLRNRCNTFGTGYCTVFTVNVSRMDS